MRFTEKTFFFCFSPSLWPNDNRTKEPGNGFWFRNCFWFFFFFFFSFYICLQGIYFLQMSQRFFFFFKFIFNFFLKFFFFFFFPIVWRLQLNVFVTSTVYLNWAVSSRFWPVPSWSFFFHWQTITQFSSETSGLSRMIKKKTIPNGGPRKRINTRSICPIIILFTYLFVLNGFLLLLFWAYFSTRSSKTCQMFYLPTVQPPACLEKPCSGPQENPHRKFQRRLDAALFQCASFLFIGKRHSTKIAITYQYIQDKNNNCH